jgi:pyrroloquinoline quinone biosynthesis protein D
MPGPEDSNVPKLAVGCRWGGSEEERMVLFPEGAVRLQGTGRKIVELCDGNRTFAELVAQLHQEYWQVDATRIRAEAAQFLEQLREKRIVDY